MSRLDYTTCKKHPDIVFCIKPSSLGTASHSERFKWVKRFFSSGLEQFLFQECSSLPIILMSSYEEHLIIKLNLPN